MSFLTLKPQEIPQAQMFASKNSLMSFYLKCALPNMFKFMFCLAKLLSVLRMSCDEKSFYIHCNCSHMYRKALKNFLSSCSFWTLNSEKILFSHCAFSSAVVNDKNETAISSDIPYCKVEQKRKEKPHSLVNKCLTIK